MSPTRWMRVTLPTIAIAVCSAAGAASAQTSSPESLEQTYARLCGSNQEGEACATLRQALIAKLSRQSESATPPLPGATVAGRAPALPVEDTTAYWGHYLDFLEAPHINVLIEGMYNINYPLTITTYEWEVPGRVIRVLERTPESSNARVATLRWDSARRGILQTSPDGTEALWVLQEDGSFAQEAASVRISERKFNSGTVEHRVEVKKQWGWDVAWIIHRSKYSSETLDLMRSIHTNSIGVARINAQIPDRYRDPAFQRAREEREAARVAQNGGFFRVLIGAGFGLAAANAAGMDGTQTLGVVAKSVAVMNPDSPAAQALGATGDAVLQGSGVGAPQTQAVAGGRTASYPTRANLVAGQSACSMMNESNYRQVGVSGGNDVQLKTMCAQAYEYYVMYKRAIAQGYAEADANRTYAAHQQAAQNALSFYATTRTP